MSHPLQLGVQSLTFTAHSVMCWWFCVSALLFFYMLNVVDVLDFSRSQSESFAATDTLSQWSPPRLSSCPSVCLWPFSSTIDVVVKLLSWIGCHRSRSLVLSLLHLHHLIINHRIKWINQSFCAFSWMRYNGCCCSHSSFTPW